MARLPDETRVGRVGLSAANLDRVRSHYADVVGLEPLADDAGRTVLGAGERPLLELTAAPDAPDRPADAAGLYHVAYRVPDRTALGDALARIRQGWQLTGASDHLVSEALYLDDPEGNGVEVYRDRPRPEWPTTPDGGVEIDTLPLDLDALAADAAGGAAAPPGTDVGHVHLEVTDIERARGFYVDALGFDVQARMRGALFVGAGGYHHHVGLNVWHGRSAPATGRGLEWFELLVPDGDALDRLLDRLADAGHPVDGPADAGGPVERGGAGATVEDPDGIELRLAVDA